MKKQPPDCGGAIGFIGILFSGRPKWELAPYGELMAGHVPGAVRD